ncbi:hypothetical protein ACG83_22775 [Frankia sp. R43]|uniref:hypothetical protein n=1 Tax=Frankia sp. R43 TaxID=269536 RepID=UPI0006CA413F|nr:hypothetical protein [Frankia sp. R43]KPM53508.1 hypothetical protein ACG83_22775 [Frankia sp. R43]
MSQTAQDSDEATLEAVRAVWERAAATASRSVTLLFVCAALFELLADKKATEGGFDLPLVELVVASDTWYLLPVASAYLYLNFVRSSFTCLDLDLEHRQLLRRRFWHEETREVARVHALYRPQHIVSFVLPDPHDPPGARFIQAFSLLASSVLVVLPVVFFIHAGHKIHTLQGVEAPVRLLTLAGMTLIASLALALVVLRIGAEIARPRAETPSASTDPGGTRGTG